MYYLTFKNLVNQESSIHSYCTFKYDFKFTVDQKMNTLHGIPVLESGKTTEFLQLVVAIVVR